MTITELWFEKQKKINSKLVAMIRAESLAEINALKAKIEELKAKIDEAGEKPKKKAK